MYILDVSNWTTGRRTNVCLVLLTYIGYWYRYALLKCWPYIYKMRIILITYWYNIRVVTLLCPFQFTGYLPDMETIGTPIWDTVQSSLGFSNRIYYTTYLKEPLEWREGYLHYILARRQATFVITFFWRGTMFPQKASFRPKSKYIEQREPFSTGKCQFKNNSMND